VRAGLLALLLVLATAPSCGVRGNPRPPLPELRDLPDGGPSPDAGR